MSRCTSLAPRPWPPLPPRPGSNCTCVGGEGGDKSVIAVQNCRRANGSWCGVILANRVVVRCVESRERFSSSHLVVLRCSCSPPRMAYLLRCLDALSLSRPGRLVIVAVSVDGGGRMSVEPCLAQAVLCSGNNSATNRLCATNSE